MKRKRFHWKQREIFKKLERNRRLCCLVLIGIAFIFFMAGCGGSPPPSSLPQKGKSPAVEKKKVESMKVAEKKEPEKKEEEEGDDEPEKEEDREKKPEKR